jgi:hypothetical protein
MCIRFSDWSDASAILLARHYAPAMTRIQEHGFNEPDEGMEHPPL